MIETIRSHEKDRLGATLQRMRERNVALDPELMAYVAAIIQDVRDRGDAALLDYAARFDDCNLKASELRVSEGTLRDIASRADTQLLEPLREAIGRVRNFHEFESVRSWEVETKPGVRLGQRITPLERAGLYVPGGSAGYPSSVVMNVVPARVAGVKRVLVTTPPSTLRENPAVAAALVELDITEVYAVGGAQAIAALAYGTETVPRVDKITGPGNKYVAAAKKQVFGTVGIDSIAGPTEVVIIADSTASARFVASDLLAQAEHAEDAAALLITDSESLAAEVLVELAMQSKTLPRIHVVEKSLAQLGAIIIVTDLVEACEIANELVPEHLEIMVHEEELVASRIENAGAIFLGEQTPEAVGDYIAGPNHVLPTCRTARFSSALSVHDFVKRTSVLKFSRAELSRTAPMIATLARAEGFEAHARSALIRGEADQ